MIAMRTLIARFAVVAILGCIASAATAHEFTCSATVTPLHLDASGKVVVGSDGIPVGTGSMTPVVELHSYPAVVGIRIDLANVASAESTVTGVTNTFLSALSAPAATYGAAIAPGLSLPVGGSAVEWFAVPVASQEDCEKQLGGGSTDAPACTDVAEGRFVVAHDAGSTECRARIVCGSAEVARWSGVKRWGTTDLDGSFGVAVDGAGNVWVGGWNMAQGGDITKANVTLSRLTAAGTLDLDERLATTGRYGGLAFASGIGSPLITMQTSDGNNVLIALDPAGGERWRAIVPGYVPPGAAVAATPDGTTYVGLDATVGPGPALSKVGPDGALLWTTHLAGIGVPDVAADASHAYSANTLAAEYAIGGKFPSRTDVLLTQLTPAGDIVWTRQLDDAGATLEPTGIAATPDGGVVVTGLGQQPEMGVPDAQANASFVARWDAAGNLLWRAMLSAADPFPKIYARAVAVDARGYTVVAGETSGLPGQPSQGGLDAFAVELDATGGVVWTRVFGTPDEDLVNGVALDAASNVYVAGGTARAGVSAADLDQFVAKLDALGNLQ